MKKLMIGFTAALILSSCTSTKIKPAQKETPEKKITILKKSSDTTVIKKKNRRLIYQPPLFLPRGIFPKGMIMYLTVEVIIKPDGRVIKAKMLRQSGKKALDRVLIDNAMKSRFEAIKTKNNTIGHLTYSNRRKLR